MNISINEISFIENINFSLKQNRTIYLFCF
jgi:hypothetical protein